MTQRISEKKKADLRVENTALRAEVAQLWDTVATLGARLDELERQAKKKPPTFAKPNRPQARYEPRPRQKWALSVPKNP